MLSEGLLEKELYRLVTLRENGQLIEMSALQAASRSLLTEAIKGKRLSQKYVLELARQAERELVEIEAERYARLVALRRQGEERLADHRHRGLSPPVLLPHPDDIVIDPFQYKAVVIGPETPEQARVYADIAWVRDYAQLCSFQAELVGNGPKLPHEGKLICAFMFLAHLIDLRLPRSCRWKEGDALALAVDWRRLSRLDREQRIATGFARLIERTTAVPRSVTRDSS
ncbi:MAG: hypothetical protein FJY55_10790 [Betaproteobacteria bacterium]|nr:hypothetical protein [Betaproteobacteria bacterium]